MNDGHTSLSQGDGNLAAIRFRELDLPRQQGIVIVDKSILRNSDLVIVRIINAEFDQSHFERLAELETVDGRRAGVHR